MENTSQRKLAVASGSELGTGRSFSSVAVTRLTGWANPGSVRDQQHKLATNCDLSRPMWWNQNAYDPKPEPPFEKPSVHAVSDNPPWATTPVGVDRP